MGATVNADFTHLVWPATELVESRIASTRSNSDILQVSAAQQVIHWRPFAGCSGWAVGLIVPHGIRVVAGVGGRCGHVIWMLHNVRQDRWMRYKGAIWRIRLQVSLRPIGLR